MATGAAASDFGYERAARHERLLSELVYEVLREDPGTDDHESVLDHCLHQTKHHRFADTDPKHIEGLFTQLGDRMASYAQYVKERALASLVTALLHTDLESDTLEVHHRILSLLYYCSDSPLNAAYQPGPVLQLLEEPGATEDPTAELWEDILVDSDALGSSSSGSALSEWSDFEAAVTDAGSPDRVREVTTLLATAERTRVGQPDAWLQQLVQSSYAQRSDLDLQPGVLPDYPAGCLFQQLAESRYKGLPFAVPPPSKCTSQRSLSTQVISMLRGCKTPGPAFEWSELGSRFQVARGVHLPHMSPGLLQNVLHHFAASGSIAVRLWAVVQAAQRMCLQEPAAIRLPTWLAFAAALGKQLNGIAEHLIAVENQVERDQQLGSLLHLRAALQGPVSQLQLLDIALQAAEEALEAATPCEISAALLTSLHRLLLHASLQAGPQGNEQAAILLKLLSSALQPLLQSLEAWLCDARLPASHEEFFVRHDPGIYADSDRFWEEAYVLRRAADASVACPTFLQPLASEILDCGRSLILLRQQQTHRPRSLEMPSEATQWQQQQHSIQAHNSAAAMLDHATAKESLQALYLLSLQQVLKGADTQKSSKAGVAHVPQRWPAAFNAPAQPVAERLAAASNWRLPRHHSLVLPQLWRDPDCMLSRLQPPSGARPQLHRPQLGEPPTDDGSVPATQRKLPASFESAAPPNVACSQSQEEGPEWSKSEGVEAAWLNDAGMRKWLQRVSGAMTQPERQAHPVLGPQLEERLGRADQLISLASFSGAAARQIWSKQAGKSKHGGRSDTLQSWLEELQAADLPPAPVLLQACLLAPVKSKVRHTGAHLLSELTSRWELRRQLEALRNLYLGGTPSLLAFTHGLITRLLAGQRLTEIPAGELQASLEDCLGSLSMTDPLPPIASLSVSVNHEAHQQILAALAAAVAKQRAQEVSVTAAAKSAESPTEEPLRTIVEIKAMTVACKVPWPVSLVVDAPSLDKYNQIWSFLLQLRWAKEAVRSAQRVDARNQPFNAAHPISHRLLHLADCLEQFAIFTLAEAWQALQQELDAVQSLQDVQAAHTKFLEAAAQPCMASSEGSWQVIYSSLRKLLDMCLCFHDIAPLLQEPSTRGEALQKLTALQAEFADRHRYLLKSLNAKSLKIDDKSGLQYLVMRLTFNRYYK